MVINKKIFARLFISVIFFGSFLFSLESVDAATQCCRRQEGATPKSCRYMNSPCDVFQACVGGGGPPCTLTNEVQLDCADDTSGLCENKVPLFCCLKVKVTTTADTATPESCRLKSLDEECDGGSNCSGRRDRNGVCQGEISTEKEVLCDSTPVCAVAAPKVNCEIYTSKSLCDGNDFACFWSGAKSRCFSKSDDSICINLNENDCNASIVCQFKGNTCLNRLEQAGTSIYGSDQTGMFLTACAVQGTCRDITDILEVVVKVAKQMFGFVGVISFAFFIYGGLTMILSFGNAEKFGHGKQILVAAVIGIVITFSAYLIVKFVLDALQVSSSFRIIN